MIREQVAKDVRVKLTKGFIPGSISHKHLMTQEYFLFIPNQEIFNDQGGEYVWVRGASHMNSAPFYLKNLELEFPIDETYRGKLKEEDKLFDSD